MNGCRFIGFFFIFFLQIPENGAYKYGGGLSVCGQSYQILLNLDHLGHAKSTKIGLPLIFPPCSNIASTKRLLSETILN